MINVKESIIHQSGKIVKITFMLPFYVSTANTHKITLYELNTEELA